MEKVDVVVIGAGPSGAIVSALLNKNSNLKVIVLEKEIFPRFVIGESLLPFCMGVLEEAGFLDSVESYGFQFKNGAAFSYKDKYTYFNFCDKSSSGYGTTFQVQRSEFDKLLIDCAIKQGVDVRFNVAVENVEFNTENVKVILNNNEVIESRFIIDASGYGRVLPRLLDLESKSNLESRAAYFTHIEDNISEILYDRNKILITTHPDFREIWYWLIPFSNGRCSIGVVGEPKFLESALNDLNLNLESKPKKILKSLVYHAPMLKRLLNNAKWDTDVRNISAYSKDVKTLYGDRFLLLGNASEFLDPVFSSGVSIAMYSASLASKLVPRILNGERLDLDKEYSQPLMLGINTFRTYVKGWYDGSFQRVIYTEKKNPSIKRKICSILAGYAWDRTNPFVLKSESSLKALAQYC